MGPLAFFLHFLVRMYKLVLSPVFGNNCRFTPSCSSYALEALENFGAFKGTWLTVKRIIKCHPWGGSGHDPIPK